MTVPRSTQIIPQSTPITTGRVPRRWRWWRDASRSQICRVAQDLIGVELTAVCRRPCRLWAAAPLHSAEAAMADIGSVETRHATILAILAGQQCDVKGDCILGNPSKIDGECIPIGDGRPEIRPPQRKVTATVVKGNGAEVVDDFGSLGVLN